MKIYSVCAFVHHICTSNRVSVHRNFYAIHQGVAKSKLCNKLEVLSFTVFGDWRYATSSGEQSPFQKS